MSIFYFILAAACSLPREYFRLGRVCNFTRLLTGNIHRHIF